MLHQPAARLHQSLLQAGQRPVAHAQRQRQPPAFTLGNLGPRLPDIRNDGARNFDLSVFKNFTATERLNVQFRAEFLNAFNTPRFGSPNTSVTSTSFGIISSQANAPRQIQFGLKFLW